MESVKMLLFLTLLIGFICLSHQQGIVNRAPYFREDVDGSLYDRLENKGIFENTPIGTTLGTLMCRDDDGDSIIGYSASSNTIAVEEATGVVTVNRVIDREKYVVDVEAKRSLTVLFQCWDSRQQTGATTVTIQIQDVNDNPPVFLGIPYQQDVDEDTKPGTLIFDKIYVNDSDYGLNAAVKVDCVQSENDPGSIAVCSLFRIETVKQNGTQGLHRTYLYLNGNLDFETVRSYTITLRAEDQAILFPPLNASVNVLINVKDTQDTNPEFLNLPLTIYVQENSEVGSVVPLRISARDGDLESARPVEISIINDPRGLFRLGQTVNTASNDGTYSAPVIINAPIDREELQGTYGFQVEVVELDNGVPTNFTATSNVQVVILDVNDNVPTFSQNVYNVELFESSGNSLNNTQIPNLNISITDRDIPSNAKYTVDIAQQTKNTFEVFPQDNVTGNTAVNLVVVNVTLLDFDIPDNRRQTVILEAREIATETPRTSTATVNILLKDLNDNSPVFTRPEYRFSLPENAPVGQTIAVITAVDRDEGDNGKVSYSLDGILSDTRIFNIDSTTGVLTLAEQLDYEDTDSYQILIKASDSGVPKREVTKTLTIDITNINDEPPVPVLSLYQTEARETTLELRPQVFVRARDYEDPTSLLTYRIVAGNTPDNAFQVDRLTGELTLTSLLDFDTTPNRQGFFEVIIEVSDNGNPPQFANITVKVDVQDENNNIPQFEQPTYFARIGELATEGTSVAVVSAVDLDRGDNGVIWYSIHRGGRDHFQINKQSGFISVSNMSDFDYNVYPDYSLIIHAIDYGSPPETGTATVLVQIEDANNKPPAFTQQVYILSIPEDTPVGTSVLSVTALDPDSSANLTYSIPTNRVVAQKSGGTFILSQSLFDFKNAFVVDPVGGLITTNRTLRRELASDISFQVVVEDINAESGRQTASTSVLVTILGTNISTIFFTPESYFFSVTEGKQKGYVITTVVARDPACGNCVVENYSEVDGTDVFGYLQVDRLTGQVTLSRPIDYENSTSRQLYMEIEARAADGRTGLTKIVVEVQDDNDNSPIFRQDDYTFVVSESAVYPHTVGYVGALDKDSGSFGRVTYSLSGQGATDFQVFDNGLVIVSLTANLDYETTPEYSLLVTASDNPTNQTSTVRKQTTVPLKIVLLDQNDNRPQFGAIYPFYVVENYDIGTLVGQITATDRDRGTNGEIRYTMRDPSGLFDIQPVSAYIYVANSLRDMSPLSPFIVTVRAQDSGIPALFNETKVEINVRSGQLDDGRPQWSIPRLGVVYNVTEGIPQEQFVVQARATARSSGPEVYYSLNTEGTDHLMFRVDRISGNVTTVGEFDREQQAVYDLILIATDRYNETLQSYRGLTVRVDDVNDNVPDFGNCPGVSLEVPMKVSIYEDIPINTFVYKVKACDIDEKDNAVTYRAETDNDLCSREMAGGYFRVSSDGNITTNRTLDRETKPYHLVCVRAMTPLRRKRQADGFNRTEMVDTGRIAYVVISLVDINDNRPIFPIKILRETVQSVPEERTVVRVVAEDIDLSPFNRVRYSIESIVYREPNYPALSLPGSFVIGPDTGIVRTNYRSYSDFRIPNSYFDITVKAEDFLDPEKSDTMNIYVYIFEPSQTIRLVIDKTPEVARDLADQLISDLSAADPNSLFELQQVSYHRVIDEFDVTRTDVCFVVVQNNKVLSVREGGTTLTQTKLNDIINQYGARTPGSCYRTRSSLDKIDWSPLWWVLVALAIFIFICCCILICAVLVLYRNYKNYMNTRKTYLVPQ